MCAYFKPFLIFFFLLVFCSSAGAATYTASELQIDKIFPSTYNKVWARPSGGFVPNSTVLEMAIENTVYPPSGGSALKKVIPVALTYGRWMPWAAAAFSVGYFIGDEIYTKWHEDQGVYHDGTEYYEWLEDEVIVEDGCAEGAIDAQICAHQTNPVYSC